MENWGDLKIYMSKWPIKLHLFKKPLTNEKLRFVYYVVLSYVIVNLVIFVISLIFWNQKILKRAQLLVQFQVMVLF